jgi:single-strand DNA-binding protein
MNDIDEPQALDNLAVIRGSLTSDPRTRELPAGGTVVQFDVSTRIDAAGRSTRGSVPVAWNDPTPTQRELLASGVEVVVLGTVRRRFFRVGGATQSRTEVVADMVVPTRRRAQVAAALRATADRLLAG